MFGREKRPVPLDRVEVTVGPTANINGDLVCDGIVKIDGVYGGSIKTVSNVIISEKGRVDADIEAQNVSVSGQAKGSIVAKGRLGVIITNFEPSVLYKNLVPTTYLSPPRKKGVF